MSFNFIFIPPNKNFIILSFLSKQIIKLSILSEQRNIQFHMKKSRRMYALLDSYILPICTTGEKTRNGEENIQKWHRGRSDVIIAPRYAL